MSYSDSDCKYLDTGYAVRDLYRELLIATQCIRSLAENIPSSKNCPAVERPAVEVPELKEIYDHVRDIDRTTSSICLQYAALIEKIVAHLPQIESYMRSMSYTIEDLTVLNFGYDQSGPYDAQTTLEIEQANTRLWGILHELKRLAKLEDFQGPQVYKGFGY